MDKSADLFWAHTRKRLFDISLVQERNPFLHEVLRRVSAQMSSLPELMAEVEKPHGWKELEFHFFEGRATDGVCFEHEGRLYIGISVFAAVSLYDLYSHLVSCTAYGTSILGGTVQDGVYEPLVFKPETFDEFPRVAPATSGHFQLTMHCTMVAANFMLMHELTHLWEGHGQYRKIRRDRGHELSNVERRTMEWIADRYAISRLMLFRRAGEAFTEGARILSAMADPAYGELVFNATMNKPPEYVRFVATVLPIFFWHYPLDRSASYLDRTHPDPVSRSFYVISELSRVLKLRIYSHWSLDDSEFTVMQFVDQSAELWAAMRRRPGELHPLVSAVNHSSLLRDLKRFESNAVRIDADIKRLGIKT